MFKLKQYFGKDGRLTSSKFGDKETSISFNPNGSMKGSSIKSGNLTTFYDAAYNPHKFGVKSIHGTSYYNKNWHPLKNR